MPWDARTRRRLKLRELEILMAVVQMGGMRRAANQLHMSQPAISKAIADLEHTLGVRLLDRGSEGVEPTQYGRALLKRGVAVFDELKQGVQDIEFLANPEAGELRIGSSPAQSEGVVLAVIERLSRQFPRIVFHLVPGGTQVQYNELRERRVELGVVRLFETAIAEDIDQEVLFQEPLVVVAGAENPWARRRKIELAELVNEPWAWPPAGTMINSLIVGAFRASGLEPPGATVYVDTTSMRIRLAMTGRFLAVVPAGILRLHTKHELFKELPIELPNTQGPIGIITLKNRTLSPLAQLFIKYARDVTRPLTKSKQLRAHVAVASHPVAAPSELKRSRRGQARAKDSQHRPQS